MKLSEDTSVPVRSGGAEPAETKPAAMGRREFIALLGMVSALTALAIDTMLPAFSEIRTAFDLGPESTKVSLIITVFFFGMGAGQFLYGPFSDRMGRKKALALGLAIYCVGAIGSTFAQSFEMLLVSRVIWGVGAAGPRVMSLAILRDRYSGDEMARTMMFVQATFMVVPVMAPMWGRLWLEIGDWRWTFGQAVLVAAVVAVWSTRLPETLPKSAQQSMGLAGIGRAFKEIAASRMAVGMAISQTFLLGSFFPWLGSSELIVGELYDHSGIYPFVFGGTGIAMALAVLAGSRAVKLYGSRRSLRLLFPGFVGLSALALVTAVASDGLPAFGVFLVLIAALTGLETAITPQVASLAIEPMGRIAGTASSAIGTLNFVGGAALGYLIDRQVSNTVTPIFVGFFVYSALAAAFAWWAMSDESA